MAEDKNLIAIRAHIQDIRNRVDAAARKAGRNPGEIHILAVTKTYPVAYIQEALAAGIRWFGENKVQEAKEKYQCFDNLTEKDAVQKHMVGHLQTNKVRHAVEIFDMIQTVDSLRLATEIDKRAYTQDRIMDILIQVNTSREKSKYGIPPEDTLELVKRVAELKNVRIRGLMTIGPLTASVSADPEKVRPYFRRLFELKQFIAEQKIPQVNMEHLSMGMSLDFETAVEEGATIIRIGTAIFGKRKRTPRAAAPAPNPEDQL